MTEIRRVAVLGAGVMGSQIAAHCANAGLEVLLFDRDLELASQGLQRATSIRPAAFYSPGSARRITALGIDEDAARLADVDWVCEAIPEVLDWKRQLFTSVAPHLSDGALISTNTSGLPAAEIAAVLSPAQRRRFLVTHFFNPPRYLRLLELVALPETDPELLGTFARFARETLGKGVVEARLTPNFIANRIGVFGLQRTLQLALEHGLSVEEVDALTGPLLGRPKSASFRTADVVGLDTLLHVTQGTYEACATDPWRAVFQPSELLIQLVEKGALGQKSGAGFYRKSAAGLEQLDLVTREYGPLLKPRFESLKLWRRWKDLGRRVEALYWEEDRAGRFLRALLGETLLYAAWQVEEIAGGKLESLDRALCWGFGWEMGPFRLWDSIGVRRSLLRLKREGARLAPWLDRFLASGAETFHRWNGGTREILEPATCEWRAVESIPGELDLETCRRIHPVLHRGWSASLLDLGEGVAGLEFHSVLQPQLNPIDESVIETLAVALRAVPDKGYRGLVIGHGGANFCAGANLQLILRLAESGDREAIEGVCEQFQRVILALRHAPFPVVAAPFGLCLGGGVELTAGSDAVVAHAELYAGLVEAGVGVIPAGGGCLRVLEHWIDRLAPRRPGPFPPVQQAFETIAFAKVSGSAAEAIFFGLLPAHTEIVLDRAALLERARQKVLELATDYIAPVARQDLRLPGPGGRVAMELAVQGFRASGKITEHDADIAASLARILSGGEQADTSHPVDEECILRLEREEFARLALTRATQDRLRHMLKTGKPLRN